MKRSLALLLATIMLFAAAAGCNPSEPGETTTKPADTTTSPVSTTTEAPTAPAEPKEITFARSFDPTTLDPHNTVEAVAYEILYLTGEGLLRNKNGVLQPGIAEKWDVSPDGYEYTFHLRKSTWADGTPLTAHDFVYSFLRVVDPAQAYEQAQYAYPVLKNSEQYHTGEITDASQVGVEALDDYTLKITCTTPGVETLNTLSRYPWLPIKKDVAEQYGAAYGAEAEKVMGNGPFKLVSWAHQDNLVLEKNQNYWDKDSIKLDKITGIIGAADQTGADMMLAGSLDYMKTTNAEIMQQLVDAGFESTKYTSQLQVLLIGGKTDESTAFMDNANFKLALNYALNRQAITDTLFTGGLPATRLTPPTVMGVNKPFVEEYPYEGWPAAGDKEKAKQHLELALQELGKTIDQVPELSIICYESANSVLVMQAVQDMYLSVLGINCVIDQLPIQQMFAKAFSGDFDMWWAGQSIGTMDWGSPDGFLSSFDWRLPGYTGTWKDEEFARLYDIVQTTTDVKERKDSLFAIEKILIQDNPPFITIAYTQQFVIYDAKLSGPEITSFDDITYMDFK